MTTTETLPPTAAELLNASPPLVRIVETYDLGHRALILRRRGLRVGMVLLATVAAAALAKLTVLGGITPADAVHGIGAAGCAAVCSVGVLTVQWLIELSALRRPQPERMLRAVRVHSSIDPARVAALAAEDDLDRTFDEVHQTWSRAVRSRPGSRRQRSSSARR